MKKSIQEIVDDALKEFEIFWGEWNAMPAPESCRKIDGPTKGGVYQLREKKSKKLVLFGVASKCQKRMKSLFPEPYGVGTRNNREKREYVLKHWENLDYRTMVTDCKEEAEAVEGLLKAKQNHLFNS